MQNNVPERPNMWYIFEKVIVQGCLLSLAQLYNVQGLVVIGIVLFEFFPPQRAREVVALTVTEKFFF